MNSCHHVTRYETFQIRHTENKNRQQSTKAIWLSYRLDMTKFCLHEIFIPFSCRHDFHAGMKRRHEIFMSPRNESFISPRHHVNTTVAQTSTRYENSCRHEFHVGSHVKGFLDWPSNISKIGKLFSYMRARCMLFVFMTLGCFSKKTRVKETQA